ncbi:MAG: NAD(P)-dependent glycerol-3-phosphate dehydrogenase [Lachnospiraceae bacterium]|nr:NAD(P)-dependent glycerol-3-phosphate dehydrogenase [Lachnospiraceae bacterium]
MVSIGILGAGTWGMALARMLTNCGHDVTVWSALPDEIDRMKETRRQINLPGMVLPDDLLLTKSVSEVCSDKEILLFAVPSVFVRRTAKEAAPFIPDGQIIADVAKGIEPDTLFTMTQVIRDELARDGRHSGVSYVALSGPTHAEEVARDLPTTIVSSCEDMRIAEKVQDVFMNSCMRVYTNPDILGVELCGAVKNIIALAAGMCEGLGYGDNAKAALITRGMAEITRLGLSMGCRAETFQGLAGIGDLIVTATSRHSRNNRCGCLIGQGIPTKEAVEKIGMVVEGINAIPAVCTLSEKYGVEMPISRAVDEIINRGADPRSTVMNLMTRRRRAE